MRSLIVVCALAGVASAEGKAGDWAHFEVERTVPNGTISTPAVALYSGLQGTKWFVGDASHEQRWPDLDNLWLWINDMEKSKTTRKKAACKFATTAQCTKLTYNGEWMGFGAGSKVVVTITLAPQVRGAGVADLEVSLAGKLQWKMKVIGYGNGAKASWGTVPWKTAIPGAPLDVVEPYVNAPDRVAERFVMAAPTISPLVIVSTKGDLDKAIIRRYLKRQLAKLTYCYEKELVAKPTLEGAIEVTFGIGPDGKVTTTSAKGLDNEVETCASGVVKAIEFPKPKNNSSVDVTFSMRYRLPKAPPAKLP